MKQVGYAHQGGIYLIKNTGKTVFNSSEQYIMCAL